jgi:transposase
MIGLTSGRPIFLATGTTDLRKSFTGLYALVRERLAQEPLSGAVFAPVGGVPVLGIPARRGRG